MLIDTNKAADWLDQAPNTLAKMRVTGGGPRFVKLGRSVRYRVSDLEAYIADRVVTSTSEKVAA